ncbi:MULTISPECIES: hydantoinase B/oxoprolinase family protein [unclassified Saccharopolyspora]|uniref:hydantoinase B/oxoprolinase family protein n=1 Tax=unclassified Saccharopolyspora TaxID=2646250 RepID=UPI001CD27CAE|nr:MULTISPECIES: hydantoinase B/oxoprolinase family protein [unclassified Saccharopolyspora]MCA1194474.1 hydantoinase B/oxoprolinase family protein [Saccharopolyspora sp. 6V]MCA1226668.1 hydantoinase B/oxoprolinase family protein [Saccharopolyspora sp. 6M]
MTTNSTYIPAGFDPVTLEVLRMRLDSIVEEMGSAMIRSSGSPVITESGDFNTALFDPEGRIYSYSDFVQFHIGSGSVAVQNLVAEIEGEPLHPGDAFICNDPHTAGSAHPPDTNVISPIFYGDELIGWAQSQAHLVDVGGMTPGGFAPGAYDCYSEALRLPPGVKVFERGKPVEWVRRVLLNNVRVPTLFWNDVRSLVASNNTGIRRLCGTVEEFGLAEFREHTRVNFEIAERVVRERIALLTDGVYEADEWTEHNGHVNELYRVHCTMTKSGDQITMDFAGSSPQTDGFINLSYGTLVGSVASALVPILAWDVPFNEGVMTACTVLAERGSLVNPLPPAPISNGHLTTGARVSRLVTKLLNEAARTSDSELIRARTQGVWADSWTGGISAGSRDDGEFFVLFNMDGGGMGTGAQPVTDGLDCGGMMTQVNNALPDVEMNEMLYPVLYLWKRLNLDSAGHGAHRGGHGHEFAWKLHGAREVTQTVFAPNAQVVADGFGGGFAGGGSGHAVWRGTNINDLLGGGTVPTDGELTADRRDLLEINQQDVTIGSDDVFVQWVAGGGGYGDPLLRDPELVARDVADGYLTAAAASRVYGVEFTGGGVDRGATEHRRTALRTERLGGAVPVQPVSAGATAESSAPRRDAAGWYCPASGARLGTGADWRPGALIRTGIASERLSELGVRVRARESEPAVWIDELISPACGTLLETRIRVAPREEGKTR